MERRRAFDAITSVMSGLAENRPVLLVLDDLQNAGRATVELLHFLGRHAGRARLLVVATVRAEEGGAAIDALSDVSDRIELGPLPAEAVGELATAAGCGELADTILQRTRGHALFVTETLRAVASGETGVPESLRAAVLARVRRAGPEIEELLRAGAVLGASVDPAIVGGLLDVPARCRAAVRAGAGTRLLVVAGRNYEFANDLVQEVLYATTPAPTRLAYHRRAADLLADHPESVAAHAAAARTGHGPRAPICRPVNKPRTDTRSATPKRCSAGHCRPPKAPDDSTMVGVLRCAVTGLGLLWLSSAGVGRCQGRSDGGPAGRRSSPGDAGLAGTCVGQPGRGRAGRRGRRRLARLAPDRGESLGDRAGQAEVLGRLAVISGSGLQFIDALDRAMPRCGPVGPRGTTRP